MERKFELFCVKGVNKFGEVDNDLVELFFSINGDLVDWEEYDNIGDIIYSSHEMLHRNCDKYNFDGRRDNLIVNLNYEFLEKKGGA
jgi:hypothetical protein